MKGMRWVPAAVLVWSSALAQEARPPAVLPTAVYTLADHHTTRWTGESDPVSKIVGVCRITPGQPLDTLTCLAPPVSEPRTGRRHFYSIVLFRDLEETVYMAACAALTRESQCGGLKAGQTFSAEVEEHTIRIVARGEQLPLRILERRPRPVTVDSPTRGTPSQVRPSVGAPSAVPYSRVPDSRGTPSDVRPSQVAISGGAPSHTPPSNVSSAAVSSTSARLYLYCPVGSAQVYVDGQPIGQAPVEIPVVPGRRTVRVQAQGFRPWVRTIEIPPGAIVRTIAELER